MSEENMKYFTERWSRCVKPNACVPICILSCVYSVKCHRECKKKTIQRRYENFFECHNPCPAQKAAQDLH